MGQLCQANELSKRLAEVPGVGPVTATIVAADLGEGQHYAMKRQTQFFSERLVNLDKLSFRDR